MIRRGSTLGVWISSVLVFACALAVTPAEGRMLAEPCGWDDLSATDRRKALEKYDIYKRLPPSRQKEIRQNYREWQDMEPTDRDGIRENYELYRSLTPKQRREVGERFQRDGSDR